MHEEEKVAFICLLVKILNVEIQDTRTKNELSTCEHLHFICIATFDLLN